MTKGEDPGRRRLLGIEARILISFTAIALFALVFAAISSEMAEGETLAWDRAILLGLRQPNDLATTIGPAWLRTWMGDITALGGMPVLTTVTALVAGYLLITRRTFLAAFLIGSAVSGSIAGTLLKQFFARGRPEIVPRLVDVQSMSYPSGHALNSAVIYLTLGALLARTEDRRRVKIYIVCSALFLAIAIGISRVYLGVHYPSDVVAGWFAGAAWAATCATVARQLQHRDRLERS